MIAIALTGAGISKSAGIPTFQDFPGMSAKLSVQYKNSNPNDFNKTLNILKTNCTGKLPTKAHKALADSRIPIITMNVDGLHQAAGSDYVLEIHGNVFKNNVVLYGEQIHFAEESVNLIYQCQKFCKENFVSASLIIIGTSMQTNFPNYLVTIAERFNFADNIKLSVKFINEDADNEVPKVLKDIEQQSQMNFLNELKANL